MANKMLIDASHPEETRVVVLRGNRVQEFDFEAADKRPLRGNIYLAKVTRVEPSLQAAFVDYGGNRHGFLAFAEIHPDYYQIPVADRLALLEEESRAHQLAEEEEHRPHGRGRRSRRRGGAESAEKRASANNDVIVEELHRDSDERSEVEAISVEGESIEFVSAGNAETETVEFRESDDVRGEPAQSDQRTGESDSAPVVESAPVAQTESAETQENPAQAESASAGDLTEPHAISVDPEGFSVVETGVAEERPSEEPEPDHEAKARRQDERDAEHEREREDEGREHAHDEEHDDELDHVEHIGGDAMEEVPYRHSRPRRQYKIQEVIKRRQVLLVQVVKEERGNKGAALTTYLSLAGTLFGADAEHGARRRHFAQDHRHDGSQATEGDCAGPRRAGRHGSDFAHRGRHAHQGRGQTRFRISAAHVGERARTHACVQARRRSFTRKAR